MGLSWFDRGFDIDFRTASDLALEGDVIFIFDGDRGISGDTVFDPGAMAGRI